MYVYMCMYIYIYIYMMWRDLHHTALGPSAPERAVLWLNIGITGWIQVF